MTAHSREDLEMYILNVFQRAANHPLRYVKADQELRENLLAFLAKENYTPVDLDSIILQIAVKVLGKNKAALNMIRKTASKLKEQMFKEFYHD